MSMPVTWWDREGGERMSSPLRFLEVDYTKCNKYHLYWGQVWRVSISSVTGEGKYLPAVGFVFRERISLLL